MNAFSNNVIPLRPADEDRERWLVLTLANNARHAGRSYNAIGQAAMELTVAGHGQADLASSSTVITAELAAVIQQLDYCLMLSRQMAEL